MEYRFDFNDQLPDLPIAFDLDAVAQLFQEKVIGPGRTVTVRKLQDAKYAPSRRCVTTYEMEIETPGSAPISTIGAVEFTPMARSHGTTSMINASRTHSGNQPGRDAQAALHCAQRHQYPGTGH